jgi:flagellar motor switch protein FliM
MLSQDEIDNLLSSLSVSLDTPAAGEAGTAAGAQSGFSEEFATAGVLEKGPGEKSGSKRGYKLYNFRRPDKFSKDHLRTLQTLHENFARQLGMILTAYLRMTVQIEVVSVDQLTYDEFVRSMPTPMTVSIVEMDPLPGQVLMGMGYEVASSVIDRMLGGPGLPEAKPRELTDIEQSLIRRVLDRATMCLEEAWRSMMNVNVAIVGMEESYALIQVASSGEIVALITFEINLGNRNSGLISLCIPYPVLEGIIGQLSVQHIFQRQQANIPVEEQAKILKKLNYARMPVQVKLAGTEISIKDLLDLSIGDVIRLDRGANEELLFCVNQRPKFYCRPGQLKDKLAVCVSDNVTDEEAIEGFGLK